MKHLCMCWNLLLFIVMAIGTTSCASSSFPVSFLCEDNEIELYVEEQYMGNGLVRYVVPKGTDYVKVSCRHNGEEVYSRNVYVKGQKNMLIDISVPQDYKYSTTRPNFK